MLNIFIKDLRQNLFIFLACILLPLLVPPVSSVFFKSNYEDAKNIIYITLAILFLPIYISILSSGILKNENINLLKTLPVSHFKIVLSKFLFIISIYLILSILYFSFINFERLAFLNYEFFLSFLIYTYIVLLISFASFSFSKIFKKDLAVLLVFIIAFASISSFYFVLIKTKCYMLLAFEIYLFYFFIFIFSILLFFISGKYFLLNKRFGFFKILLIIFLFLFPSIYLFLNENQWMKNSMLLKSFIVSISEEEILVDSFFEKDLNIYNFKTKKFNNLTELSGLEVNYYDEKENKIFLKTYGNKCKFNDLDLYCSLHYLYDPSKNKLEKLGQYPWRSIFKKEIICWYDWEEDNFGNKYLIGFKNGKKDIYFKDFADSCHFLKDGLLYKKIEEEGDKIYYVDYEKIEKKEILRGKLEIIITESALFFARITNSEKDYCYLLKDKEYFKLSFPSLELINIGSYEPFVDFENGNLLAIEEKGKNITLYLLKNEKIVKKIEKPFLSLWTYGPIFKGKYKIINFNDINGSGSFIASIEEDQLKIFYLPEKLGDCFFLKKEGEMIIIKKKKIPFLKEKVFHKPYLYNFKTGKERAL